MRCTPRLRRGFWKNQTRGGWWRRPRLRSCRSRPARQRSRPPDWRTDIVPVGPTFRSGVIESAMFADFTTPDLKVGPTPVPSNHQQGLHRRWRPALLEPVDPLADQVELEGVAP